jgi:hypothetical protein
MCCKPFFLRNDLTVTKLLCFNLNQKASKKEAGSCKNYFYDKLYEETYKNLFVDLQYKTDNWDKRGMADRQQADFNEIPWSVPIWSYDDTYKRYQEQLKNRKMIVNNPNANFKWYN